MCALIFFYEKFHPHLSRNINDRPRCDYNVYNEAVVTALDEL